MLQRLKNWVRQSEIRLCVAALGIAVIGGWICTGLLQLMLLPRIVHTPEPAVTLREFFAQHPSWSLFDCMLRCCCFIMAAMYLAERSRSFQWSRITAVGFLAGWLILIESHFSPLGATDQLTAWLVWLTIPMSWFGGWLSCPFQIEQTTSSTDEFHLSPD